MTVIERFQQIISSLNLSAGTFADQIGVSPGTISHILSGRNKYPSTEVILRIHETFPQINLNWLLTGEGESGLDQVNSEPIESTSKRNENTLFSAEEESSPNNGKENEFRTMLSSPYPSNQQHVIFKERPQRKITEIRIFFDDNTYETFTP